MCLLIFVEIFEKLYVSNFLLLKKKNKISAHFSVVLTSISVPFKFYFFWLVQYSMYFSFNHCTFSFLNLFLFWACTIPKTFKETFLGNVATDEALVWRRTEDIHGTRDVWRKDEINARRWMEGVCAINQKNVWHATQSNPPKTLFTLYSWKKPSTS